MSVKANKLPPARTLLGVLDAKARESVTDAKRAIAPIVNAETPRRRGETARALQPRVSRTKTGTALRVAAPRGKRHSGSGATINQIVRWATRGTGLRRQGPGPKAPIRPKGAMARMRGKRLNVYGRYYRSVKGQKPNPFIQRIQQRGTPIIERIFQRGAREAARAVERTVR